MAPLRSTLAPAADRARIRRMSSSSATTPPGLLSAELRALARPDQLRRFRAGETIFAAGDPGDGLYVIESGKVRITAMVANAEPRVLATFGPGDFLGEMAVLDAAPRSAHAQAETDTCALFLSRDEFLQLLEARPPLALGLIRDFSRRMRSSNQKYLDEIMHAELLAAVGRFAGTIAHDFKSPLSIISLSSQLATSERASPASRQRAADNINKQVQRMTGMLNELMEVVRPSGRAAHLTAVPFANFLQPLVEEIRAEIANRDATLELAGPVPALTVALDAQRLSRVFYNLINNAIDAMDADARVTLAFAVQPDALRVEVRDTGKGIAPEIAANLFQPFATHGKAHGTGLGLSICKKIIESHGGRIWADSRPGQGTTFAFTLPLAQ